MTFFDRLKSLGKTPESIDSKEKETRDKANQMVIDYFSKQNRAQRRAFKKQTGAKMPGILKPVVNKY